MLRSLTLLMLVVAVVTGCAAAPPAVVTSSPEPINPIFHSEEEALAAATTFMERYVSALSVLTASGGADDDALIALVAPEQLSDERAVVNDISERGLTFAGSYGFYNLEIQQYNQDTADEAYLQAYVCMDYRGSYFIRADGTRYKGEVEWAPFEAIMTSDRQKSITLVELRGWTGRDFCGRRR